MCTCVRLPTSAHTAVIIFDTVCHSLFSHLMLLLLISFCNLFLFFLSFISVLLVNIRSFKSTVVRTQIQRHHNLLSHKTFENEKEKTRTDPRNRKIIKEEENGKKRRKRKPCAVKDISFRLSCFTVLHRYCSATSTFYLATSVSLVRFCWCRQRCAVGVNNLLLCVIHSQMEKKRKKEMEK